MSDNFHVRNTNGRALSGTGDAEGARRYYAAAIDVAENAHQRRVASYNLRFVDVDPTEPLEGSIAEQLHAAFDRRDEGDLEGAARICGEIVRVQPTLIDAWKLLAYAKVNLGHHEEAEAAYS